MVSEPDPTLSWSETLDQLAQKHQSEAGFDTTKYLQEAVKSGKSIDDLPELIDVFRMLRDDLDEETIHKDLKSQIILDVLEVIFEIYDGTSFARLLTQLLTIFNPMDYAKQLFYKMEEKLQEYQNEDNLSDTNQTN